MRKQAFSFVEVLIVLGIIMLLVSISVPVIFNARKSSNMTACTANLRQLHIATTLYRQEWNGDGVYGNSYVMGLPPGAVYDALPIFLRLRCSDAGNEFFTKKGIHYYKYWLEPEVDRTGPTWESYSAKYQGESILIADMNHNPKSIPLVEGTMISRFGIGIRENGSLARRHKQGDWLTKTWWN